VLIINSIVLIFVIVLDRLSKIWAYDNLRGSDPISIFNDLFELRYSENTGMAFSILSDKPGFLFALVSLIILGIVYFVIQQKQLDLSIAFILAGGLGNLIDRLMYGFVIDFINPLFIDFAIFNFADIALNLGAILLIIQYFRTRKINIDTPNLTTVAKEL
jgi:signal peptidase II